MMVVAVVMMMMAKVPAERNDWTCRNVCGLRANGQNRQGENRHRSKEEDFFHEVIQGW